MIGMCFAECSGLFDETGGAYIYAKKKRLETLLVMKWELLPGQFELSQKQLCT